MNLLIPREKQTHLINRTTPTLPSLKRQKTLKEFTSLTIRLIPQKRESLIGYFIRLAHANGLSTVYDLISTVQLSRLVQAKLSISDSLWLNQILGRETTFESEIPPLKSNQLYVSHRLLKPKVCIFCLKENGIHKDNWQHAHHLVCEIHETLLISTCHTCKAPLEWDTALLGGRCANKACNEHLILEDTALPSLSAKQIDDCLLVDLITTTQAKCLTQKRVYCDVKDINKALYQNCQRLNDKDLFYNQVIKPVLSSDLCTSAYPISIKVLPLSFIIKHLKEDWSVLLWLKAYIQTGTRNLGNNETFPDVWMKVQDISEVLELSREDIKHLYKTKHFKSKTGAHFINNSSILELSGLFSALQSTPTEMQKRFLSYSEVIINTKAYHTPIFAIIYAMLSGRLSYHYYTNRTLLCSLFVDEGEITEFAREWLLAHKETCMTIREFISLFELNSNDISELFNATADINKPVKLSKLKAIVLPNYLHKLTFKN